MQNYNQRNSSGPESATVKLVGSKELVRLLAESVEENFYTVRTSDYMENRGSPGVHIFLKVVGVRK